MKKKWHRIPSSYWISERWIQKAHPRIKKQTYFLGNKEKIDKKELNYYVISIVLSGSKSWTIYSLMKRRLEVIEPWFYRMILWIPWTENLSNEEGKWNTKMKSWNFEDAKWERRFWRIWKLHYCGQEEQRKAVGHVPYPYHYKIYLSRIIWLDNLNNVD